MAKIIFALFLKKKVVVILLWPWIKLGANTLVHFTVCLKKQNWIKLLRDTSYSALEGPK